MDEYIVDVDDTLDNVIAWVRTYLRGQETPPSLDLGDRILWFADDDMRQVFVAKSEEARRGSLSWLPCLGWWNGELQLVAGREEALDAAQHALLTAMAKEYTVRLLADGFHPTPIDDLIDPELYE